jgi:hypothetical protein
MNRLLTVTVALMAATTLHTQCFAQASAVIAADSGVAKAVDPDRVKRQAWRSVMSKSPVADKGCFHASYPNLVWEKVECEQRPGRAHPIPREPATELPFTVGGASAIDYGAQSQGLILAALGSFPVAKAPAVESVGVSAYSGGAVLGNNEYSLQLNTNNNGVTAACAGHPICEVWQQFIYSTDLVSPGKAAIFMQYWLMDWFDKTCPTGWRMNGPNCFKSSPYTVVPDIPIANLDDVSLAGITAAGSLDAVDLYYGTEGYRQTNSDSVLDMATVWTSAEFGVYGDGGGSEALFYDGASLTVQLALIDGTEAAPVCRSPFSTTGESNDLTLGPCQSGVDYLGFPYIEYTETGAPFIILRPF